MKEEKKVIDIQLDDILPNRFQPRIRFDEDAINELAESIKEHGVIQPIVVRPIADKYEIIAGERRYKASVMAGMKTIPALVTNLDDKESAEIALIENVQRQDLTPIEEAVSYKKILDMGYLTQNQLADKLGKDQSTVANKLRLLNLDDEVQEALLNEKISERHARSLLKLGHKDQRELLHQIISKRLTVRKTDEEINKLLSGRTEVKPTPKVEETEILDLGEEEPKKEETKVEDFNNTFNIPDSPIVNDTKETVNPGFMDINQIEQNATDIYTEKPSADINNLLEPDATPLAAPSLETEQEEEPQIRPGRFFNMFEENENPEPQTSNPTNEFNLNGFDTQPIMPNPEPIQTETPSVEEMPVIHDVKPIQEPVSQIQPVTDTETLDLDDFDIPEIEPVKPIVQAPTGPITEPDYSFETDLEPTISAPNPTPTPVVSSNDIKTAIDMIRKCSSQIEQAGFVVDVDEFDFEDMYQVIFKIEKKK